MDRVCDVLFGARRGELVHQMIEDAIQDRCPCLRGEPCVLLTPKGELPLLPMPRVEER